ncbi:MAG: response regulator [Lachnospiraceae bacterium]|nr:response regulator [Lachnospiraceae bacterium]
MGRRIHKVLIVEDERNIGILIQKLIHWQELHIELVGVLENGETALQVIGEKAPDIVLTDIKMPKLDGLGLIAACKERGYDIRFIIISGYKEFDYAHRAIGYGVDSYLLKPIQEMELNATIQAAIEKKDQQNTLDKKEDLLLQVEEREKQIKLNYLKNVLIHRGEGMESYPFVDEDHLYRAISIKLDYLNFLQTDARQDELVMNRVIQLAESHFMQLSGSDLNYVKSKLRLSCLLGYHTRERGRVNSLLNSLLTMLQELMISVGQYVVTIGIGEETDHADEISRSMVESCDSLYYRLTYGTSRLIFYDCVEQSEIDREEQEQLDHVITVIRRDTPTYQYHTMESMVRDYFSPVRPAKQDAVRVYHAAKKMADVFFDSIEIAKKEEKKQSILDSLEHCNRFSQLSQLLTGTFRDCMRESSEMAQRRSSKPIRFIENYCETHFADKITLDDMSAMLEMNPDYLSDLFKKETNKNFSAYITEIRMHHAKKLLVESNETIASIAERVGYSDPKYFSQLFKKTIGVKPIVYRQLRA